MHIKRLLRYQTKRYSHDKTLLCFEIIRCWRTHVWLHYLVDKEVFTEKGSLLCSGLLAFPCQEVLESRCGILQLLEVERLPPDGEMDVVLSSAKQTSLNTDNQF